MRQIAPSVDTLRATFRALPSEERDQFMERVIADAILREELEDLLDLAVVRERAGEQTRRLADVLAELEKP